MSSLPVAIVTGSNSGLGLSLVVQLSTTHIVYAGMRSVSKSTALHTELELHGNKERVRVIEMDPNSDVSVLEAVKRIVEGEGRIDVLINNAGYSLFV